MQTIKCRIDHNATDDSDDGIYKRPDELRLRFTLKDGSSKLRKKVTIAARDLRKLAMTESEKVLLSMNAWSMQMKFLPHTEINTEDYEAVAKEWRYERLQQMLFEWHNGELPNNEDPNIAAFVEQLPQFTDHCARCFELRAEHVYKLKFVPAKQYDWELLDAGEHKCSDCDELVMHVFSY